MGTRFEVQVSRRGLTNERGRKGCLTQMKTAEGAERKGARRNYLSHVMQDRGA